MVFTYPASGISLSSDSDGNKQIEVITREVGAPFSCDEWKETQGRDEDRRPTFNEPIQQTLRLLLVNKQILKEAFRHFYENNLFCFSSIADLGMFLRNTPAYRRQHLKRIAFDSSRPYPDYNHAPSAFTYLASLPNLSRLHLYCQESLSISQSVSPAHTDPILGIPGISALRLLRGLDEVTFSGDCARVRMRLKQIMEGHQSKKRRSTAVEVEDWGRPKRTVRARKVGKNQ